MKTLVTGAAGFIGMHVAQALLAHGDEVVGWDNLSATVFGPWGRPDMAYYTFTRAILAGQPIAVFNHGDMRRDFTYIDDIVDGVLAVLERPPAADGEGAAPYRVLNIGGADPVPLLDFIAAIERALGVRAQLDLQPMQPGDVHTTHADVTRLRALTGLQGRTTGVDEGVRRFAQWYCEFHGVRHERIAA